MHGQRARSKEDIPMEQQLLRAQEVARILSLSRSKVFLMIASGELPAIRIGRAVRVPASALREWIAQQTEEQSGSRYPRWR